MPTNQQKLGNRGEELVRKKFDCFKCKRSNSLKKLTTNFKCADLICDLCGFLAQVKTTNVSKIDVFPNAILGAAWQPQKERMDAGIYFPIFFVLVNKNDQRKFSVFYLSADLQNQKMFKKRKPLSESAKRAGWQGYTLDGEIIGKLVTRLI